MSLNSVANFELEENDFSGSERNGFIEVTVRKNIRLANPVTVELTPYTIEEATNLGQLPISVPDDDDLYSPNRASCEFPYNVQLCMIIIIIIIFIARSSKLARARKNAT